MHRHMVGIQLQAALILGALLKANTDAAVAVFLSLRNSKTRRDALNAAADAMLKGEERDTFGAVFLFAGTVEKERNALAHGIWGYSADIPDAVLWTPLDAHAHFLIQTYKRDAARTHTSDPHTDLKRAMFVYKTSATCWKSNQRSSRPSDMPSCSICSCETETKKHTSNYVAQLQFRRRYFKFRVLVVSCKSSHGCFDQIVARNEDLIR